ncbi:Nitrosoguanidine resistance protein SNG1 [Cyphellophora attinorum]|uniref:Nitrosoguanidine resistance protein SNG1 n=1 Tax=Cyphellophora attinorum TaxID=1664694 RepID=A0A0N1P1W0_9EURO|nr:Nitrosoguanidine resistance protein SNG1 [Phialophora attinorum]KPI45102.1 Nitrosoguanidine resistance protein SNG1 [Phialophora attinorum]
MWAFQGHQIVQSPGKHSDQVSSDDSLSPSRNTLSRRPSFGEVENAHDHGTQFKHHSWPTSDSASTLTADTASHHIAQEEKDSEAAVPSRPKPARFWSDRLKTTRQTVFRKYAVTLLVLCIFVLGVLSIYWGALFRIKDNLHNATIAVVDFDGRVSPYKNTEAIVGPFVADAVRRAAGLPRALGYKFHQPAEYDNDPAAVRRAVHHDDIWGAIIINANATALLRAPGACQLIYNQARDVEAENQYIIPTLLSLASSITTSFGGLWTELVLTNTSLSASTYANSPQALSPGIDFTVIDIRPFDPPVAIPAVSIGLIYLIIIAFFSFSFFMPIHGLFLNPTQPTPHPPIKFTHLICWRYFATIVAYFFLSLAYSLVSLAFQIPFSNQPADGTTRFPTDASVSNANLIALGLPLEIAAMLLPNQQPWTSLFLIFWVITNVSTGFYALELAPSFYRWGYGWPLRQIVFGSRSLLFGTRQELGLNFGVLFAWVVVASLIWVPSCFILRRRMMKQKAGGAGGGGSARWHEVKDKFEDILTSAGNGLTRRANNKPKEHSREMSSQDRRAEVATKVRQFRAFREWESQQSRKGVVEAKTDVGH